MSRYTTFTKGMGSNPLHCPPDKLNYGLMWMRHLINSEIICDSDSTTCETSNSCDLDGSSIESDESDESDESVMDGDICSTVVGSKNRSKVDCTDNNDGVEMTTFVQHSLDEIIELITSENMCNTELTKAVLYTYRIFSTSDTLLEKLKQRYNSSNSSTVKIRVINVIHKWVEISDPDDFSPSIVVEIFKLFAKADTDKIGTKKKFNFGTNRINIHIPVNKLKRISTTEFTQFPTVDIARQITLINYQSFKRIKIYHLISNTNSFTKLMSSTNWAVWLVVQERNMNSRVRIVEFLIELAQELFNLNNFSGCVSVLGSLNSVPVNRLKNTFSRVSKEHHKTIGALNYLLDRTGVSIRKVMLNCTPPIVPCINIFKSDLNKIKKENSFRTNGKINLEKIHMLYEVVSPLITYQSCGYTFNPIYPILLYLDELPEHSNKKLYELSYLCEPKDK